MRLMASRTMVPKSTPMAPAISTGLQVVQPKQEIEHGRRGIQPVQQRFQSEFHGAHPGALGAEPRISAHLCFSRDRRDGRSTSAP